jgi:quinol monooxygenase YgiN
VLHLRLNLITAEPPVLDECLRYIETEVRPAMEREPGSLGLSLLVRWEPGVAVLESFWVSEHALVASEQAAASVRGELARLASGPVAEEQYRIAVFEREVLGGGEAVRMTRIEAKPSAVDDVIEVFGDSAVPWLAESPGYRGALLLADPQSGHLVSQTVWQDAQARAASPSTAAVIQADVLDSADLVIRAVEDYSLVFSSARKP